VTEEAGNAWTTPGVPPVPHLQNDGGNRLTARCDVDENSYAKGVKVLDAEMATLNIETSMASGILERYQAPSTVSTSTHG
jgi:hypothetical protein